MQGPQAPADAPLGLCAVCAAIGKWLAMQEIKHDVEAHESRGQGVKRWVLAVPKEYLQRAACFGVVPSMGAALPVCWSHMMALQPTSGGLIVAHPGLPNGGRDIPLLGQGPQ